MMAHWCVICLKVYGSNLHDDKKKFQQKLMGDFRDSKLTPYCLFIFMIGDPGSQVESP